LLAKIKGFNGVAAGCQAPLALPFFCNRQNTTSTNKTALGAFLNKPDAPLGAPGCFL
jgi:hypothetical protein